MKKERELTTADLVLLSLLAEKPMHGYQANAELERREVSDWAAISRPQIYYSLEKLARLRLLRSVNRGESGGPEKQSYAVTKAGAAALADALERQDWCVHRDKPPFLTWLALSWQARKGVFAKQLQRRKEFLRHEICREKKTLREVLQEVGHSYHEAVWMLKLMIAELETELRWIAQLEKELRCRAPSQHPALL